MFVWGFGVFLLVVVVVTFWLHLMTYQTMHLPCINHIDYEIPASMAQQVKVPITKPDDLSSVPRTHTAGEKTNTLELAL